MGSLRGLLLMKAYFESRKEKLTAKKIIVPDSAHGTNPASAAMAGFEVVSVKSRARRLRGRGGFEVIALRRDCWYDDDQPQHVGTV